MSVQLATFAGAPKGMVRATAQHELQDEECWTVIDSFLNQDGFITRRAGLAAPVAKTDAAYALGLAGTASPGGTWAGLQVLRPTAGTGLTIAGFKNSTLSDIIADNNHAGGTLTNYPFVDSKDSLHSGCLIGVADQLGARFATRQTLAYYRGASLPAPAGTYTPSPAVAIGNTTITITTGGANWTSGHFVFGSTSGSLIGCVKSVSGNVLTLEYPALAAEAATITGATYRGIGKVVSKGRITTSTASTTVNGGETKFKANGMAAGTWDIFTTERTFVGTVSAVASDTQLTLSANAAVSLLNADYLAYKRNPGYGTTSEIVGWMNASYAGHQFFATGNVLTFSDDDSWEAVDTDNDTIVFSEDLISSVIPAAAGLVVTSETEAYALLGAVGTTPDRWRGDRIHDDGCISTMTARVYKGGAIWAGRKGIWYWNGDEPVNIAGALGDVYQHIIEGSTGPVYGAVSHGHYFLHVPSTGQTDIRSFTTADPSTGTPLTALTLAIKLDDGTVSVLRNVGIRGQAQPPQSVSSETYINMTHLSGGIRRARVFQSKDLFAENNSTGIDPYLCDGESGTFPRWELETKKYDIGNPQLLKLFKMLLLHYDLEGKRQTPELIAADMAGTGVADHLRFATVKGLGTEGILSAKKFYVRAEPRALGVAAQGVIPSTDTGNLVNPAAQWVWSVHRAQWWNSYARRWDGVMPASAPPAGNQSDWWIYKNLGPSATSHVVVSTPGSDRPDIEWDSEGKKLYVHMGSPTAGKMYAFDYNSSTDTYTVDPLVNGISTGINEQGNFSGTAMGRSPNGDLWVATNDDTTKQLLVTKSTDGGKTWATPVSLITTFIGGKADIVSFWDGTQYNVLVVATENGSSPTATKVYAYRIEQNQPVAGTWTSETANLPAFAAGAVSSDDEMSLAVDIDGNVYLTHETEHIGAVTTDAQWLLWKRTPAGVWSQTVLSTFATSPSHKRPAVTIDDTNGYIYVFAGLPNVPGPAYGGIIYRRAPLSNVAALVTDPDKFAFTGEFYNVHVPANVTADSGIMAVSGIMTSTPVYYSYIPLQGYDGGWQDKRLKFMKRSQHLAIRAWQGTSTITRLQLGAWALGFKPKRPGRV